MSAATTITATAFCWTGAAAYVCRVSAIRFSAAGLPLPYFPLTGNWKPPFCTGQTGNAVPSAAGTFSPSQTLNLTHIFQSTKEAYSKRIPKRRSPFQIELTPAKPSLGAPFRPPKTARSFTASLIVYVCFIFFFVLFAA